MEKNKYHTLLIMPSSPGKKIIRLSLPSFYWKMICVAAGLILLWAGAGTWSLFYHVKITNRCCLLEKEKQTAKSQLEEERQRLTYLDEQIKKIRKQAVFIQKFLGMEPHVPGKGKIGQGGEEVSPKVFSFPPDLQSSVHPTPLNLACKEISGFPSPKEIDSVSLNLNQIIETLQIKQKKLEYIPSVSPVDPQKSWISSPFGIRISPFTGKKQLHLGIDIAAWKGTPIMAPAKGKVVSVKKRGLMGLTVTIRHDSIYTTLYGHLLKSNVKKGQVIKRGDVIGYIGNSGRSTGYHLHYSVKKNGKHVNPFPYMVDWDNNHALFVSSAK